MYHFLEAGLRNLWLENGYTEHETPYGRAVAFDNVEGLGVAIAAAIAAKKGKLSGVEFRYLRLELLLSEKELGRLFGVSETVVARWEARGGIAKSADVLIRLLHAQRIGVNMCTANPDVLTLLTSVAGTVQEKIILSLSRGHWTARRTVTQADPIAA